LSKEIFPLASKKSKRRSSSLVPVCQSNETVAEEEPQPVTNIRYEDIEPAIVSQINHQIFKTRKKRKAKTKIATETAVVATTVIPNDSEAAVPKRIYTKKKFNPEFSPKAPISKKD